MPGIKLPEGEGSVKQAKSASAFYEGGGQQVFRLALLFESKKIAGIGVSLRKFENKSLGNFSAAILHHGTSRGKPPAASPCPAPWTTPHQGATRPPPRRPRQ